MKIKKAVLEAQRNEITEHHVYKRLASTVKDHNRKVLEEIAQEELRHYNILKKFSGQDLQPKKFTIFKFFLISKLLGLTFGLKLMEKGEKNAQVVYLAISKSIPEAKRIMKDEDEHEKKLIDVLKEEKLRYVGSIVLGLNDALVELTGALAGFTFALQKTSLVAVVGLITGIAAALSMGASEYLATKTEPEGKKPGRAALYTGVAYIFTVFFLVSPFFLLTDIFLSLIVSLTFAILVILFFTFYVSVAKDIPFKKRFAEMAGISLGVAGLTFLIGMLIRLTLGVDI